MRPKSAILLIGAAFLAPLPVLAGVAPLPPAYVPDLEPPNPVVGECYARVEIPASYAETSHKVLTREGHQRLSVQQPRLESRAERIMTKEPSVHYVVRQPSYATVTETVMTRPGYEKLAVTEPEFRTVTETLQQSPPRLVWKRGHPAELRAQGYIIHSTADAGVGGRGYASTTDYGRTGGQRCGAACEIWCLVEEPGDSVTVSRQVMARPGEVRRIPVPPAFETITKQVVTDPGGVEKVPVPAEYRDIHVQALTHPGATSTIDVPAEYGHVQGRRLVSEARYEWRRVVCKPGMTRSHVTPPVQYRQHHPRYSSHGGSVRPSAGLAGGQTQTDHARTYSTHAYHTQTHAAPPALSTYQAHFGAVPVRKSVGAPDRAYSGPAYAVPHEGRSGAFRFRR
ncbi:hypothetical protein [uncultured Algimonas sp.]|uniref:hypothetical protein n=1 Tax=uncultured Algimonas sp. TaxID=1547920 RepID=UPI0026169242|nr:hypothetical protein [uncultured Algimonas sp.]